MSEAIITIDVKATGENIKLLMEKSSTSVRALQEYTGLATVQSIYHWLSGKSLPTVDNLLLLSEYFLLSVNEIVKYEVTQRGSPPTADSN